MLKRILLYAAIALIPFTAAFAQAAPASTAGDFYPTMLRRGIASFDAGRDADAVRQLRIAAFGFVDALDRYQTAGTYLALAYERIGETDRARESARKVVAAQRQRPGYGALELPAAVRTAFDALATRMLTAAEVAALRTAPSPAGPAQQARPAVLQPPTKISSGPAATPSASTTTSTPGATTAASAGSSASQDTASSRQPVATPTPETSSAKTSPPAAVAGRETSPTPPKPITTEVPFNAPPPAQKPAAPPQSTSPPPAATTPPPATTAKSPAVVPAPAPKPATPALLPQLSESETALNLVAAERAVNSARLGEARKIYRDLLARGALSRSNLIRVAEGLYRARDFAPALQAFQRLGTLARGEEPYRYYLAVALYETGAYARAKDELRAALPFIEVTPDVARYQAKIDGAVR